MNKDISLSEHVAAEKEYVAWRTVVREWEAAKLPDMNDSRFNPLIRAIELWGEYLVELRLYGTPEDRAKWIAEATDKYLQALAATE